MTKPGLQPDFAALRARMVDRQLRHRGIQDPRVLEAMAHVARESFVSKDLADRAYDDNALPITSGQTISQPYMVASMLDAAAIRSGDRVLEVGTGSGYVAAILHQLASTVHTIERDVLLFETAKARLASLDGVRIRHGDGAQGWPEEAPFDVILVAAAAASIPPALRSQLSVGGRLLIPIGNRRIQHLIKLTHRAADDFIEENLAPVMFVPLR